MRQPFPGCWASVRRHISSTPVTCRYWRRHTTRTATWAECRTIPTAVGLGSVHDSLDQLRLDVGRERRPLSLHFGERHSEVVADDLERRSGRHDVSFHQFLTSTFAAPK